MRRSGWRKAVAVGALVAMAACAGDSDDERVFPDTDAGDEGETGAGGDARGDSETDPEAGAEGDAPTMDDHWHAAYGIYVCDAFLPPQPEFQDPLGIHTHGDDVVHIHPFSPQSSGERATLELFLDGLDVELDDSRLVVDGDVYEEDGDGCGGRPAQIQVAWWDDAHAGGQPDVVQDDASGLRFRHDAQAFTIAFVPEGADSTDIPLPESAGMLAELGSADTGGPVSTTPPD